MAGTNGRDRQDACERTKSREKEESVPLHAPELREHICQTKRGKDVPIRARASALSKLRDHLDFRIRRGFRASRHVCCSGGGIPSDSRATTLGLFPKRPTPQPSRHIEVPYLCERVKSPRNSTVLVVVAGGFRQIPDGLDQRRVDAGLRSFGEFRGLLRPTSCRSRPHVERPKLGRGRPQISLTSATSWTDLGQSCAVSANPASGGGARGAVT